MDVRDNAPLIAAGGGALLFISLFFKWIGADGIDSLSAWEFFDLADIILAAIALLAVAVGVMLATGNTSNLPSDPGKIVTTASLIAFGMVVIYVLDPVDIEGSGLDTKFGTWLGLIGTIGMIVGGLQLGRGPVAPATRRTTEPPTAPPPPPPPPPASPTV